MKRSRIHILIVDDDSTQGKALEEAFKRAGYQATVCNSSVKAITAAQRQEFHALFVDCMLPKMNGVDLVEEILGLNPGHEPKTFLYSGIFKDKAFIKESLERTKGHAFFTKPIDLEEVLAKVDLAFREETKDLEPPLVHLYHSGRLTDGDLVRFMEEDTTIHAFHLPILFNHLQNTRLSGELTIISAVGDVNSVSVHEGRIFSVHTPDKDTYFGGLAVGFGFVSPDEVLDALRNPARKLLGLKLIESFSLSPHAIHVILEEQLALRLSQCIHDHVVSLQWTHRKYSTPDYSLNPSRFQALLDDWLQSKFDNEWIRSTLTLWGAYELEGKFHPTIKKVETLNHLLSHPDFTEKDLSYLLSAFMKREAFLGERADEEADDFSFLEKRLDRLLLDYKEQNHFQILGIGEKAQTLEINKAFEDLKQFYDPATLAKNCPPAVMVKCTSVFNRIEEAYMMLSDDLNRAQYLIALQNRRQQLLLEHEPIYRAAIAEIQNGHAKEAAKKFQSLLDRKLEFRDLRSYRIWAGLKCDRRYDSLKLEQVPPEERHSAPYMMAKGVSYRNKGQMQKALEAFRTAHVLDPKLSIAKAELRQLVMDLEKNRGQNRALLKEVTSIMETLFGKTRRGA
jgi:CheY-like chemotaxis protein